MQGAVLGFCWLLIFTTRAGEIWLLPGLCSFPFFSPSISGTGSLFACTELELFEMLNDSRYRSVLAIVQLFIGLAALLFIGLPFVFKYSPYIQVEIGFLH